MLIIRAIEQKDLSDWQVLYKKYLAFYKTDLTESQLATLWSWFFDIEKKKKYLLLKLKS